MDFEEEDKLNGEVVQNDSQAKSSINEDIEDLTISTHNGELLAKYNNVVALEGDIISEEKIRAIDIAEITKYISNKYSKEHNNKLFLALLDSISRGKNVVTQHILEQSLTIKTDWIDAIQEGIAIMQKIVAKPKLSLRDERELVKVERAKRVDAVAVRHLSTHTQYIKVVKDDGSVVPSNIMTRNLEEEMAIYENRFLYALLLRMKSFVTKRYNVIVEHAKIKDSANLSYVSSFKMGTAEVDCKLNIDVKTDKVVSNQETDNTQLLKQIGYIKDQISAIEASPFMQVMKKAKMVYPPIQRTNILTSNPEYSACYKLWMMLSSYSTVGYSVNIMEKQLPIDSNYYEDLTKIVATSAQVMLVNNKVREAIYAQVAPSKLLHKEFRVKRSANLLTNVFKSKKYSSDQDITDFYYEKMKSMILHLNDLADTLSLTSEKDVPKKSMFKTIFNQVQKINNQMYNDILKLEYLENEKQTNDKLLAKYRAQKKLCERYTQLKDLKEAEYKKAILDEKAQKKKLENISNRIARQKAEAKLKEEQEQILEQKKLLRAQLLEEKEIERQKKLEEKKKLRELAKVQKQKEQEKQKAIKQKEREKQLALAKKAKEKEHARLALNKQKEKQKKLAELEKQKQKQLEQNKKQRELAKAQKQKELEKQKALKQKEINKQKALKLQEQEKQKALKLREIEKQRTLKLKEQEKQLIAKQKEAERNKKLKAIAKEKERLEVQKQKEKLAKQKELERQKKLLLDAKLKEKAKAQKQRELEKQKALQAKQKQMQLIKKQKEKEKQAQEIAKQKQKIAQNKAKLQAEKVTENKKVKSNNSSSHRAKKEINYKKLKRHLVHSNNAR